MTNTNSAAESVAAPLLPRVCRGCGKPGGNPYTATLGGYWHRGCYAKAIKAVQS